MKLFVLLEKIENFRNVTNININKKIEKEKNDIDDFFISFLVNFELIFYSLLICFLILCLLFYSLERIRSLW